MHRLLLTGELLQQHFQINRRIASSTISERRASARRTSSSCVFELDTNPDNARACSHEPSRRDVDRDAPCARRNVRRCKDGRVCLSSMPHGAQSSPGTRALNSGSRRTSASKHVNRPLLDRNARGMDARTRSCMAPSDSALFVEAGSTSSHSTSFGGHLPDEHDMGPKARARYAIAAQTTTVPRMSGTSRSTSNVAREEHLE